MAGRAGAEEAGLRAAAGVTAVAAAGVAGATVVVVEEITAGAEEVGGVPEAVEETDVLWGGVEPPSSFFSASPKVRSS